MKVQFASKRVIVAVALLTFLSLSWGIQSLGASEESEDLGSVPASDDGGAFQIDNRGLVETYRTWDICNDSDAIESGFSDPESLEDNRRGVGVDCKRGITKYLLESVVGGETFILDERPDSPFVEAVRERDEGILQENPTWVGTWSGIGETRLDAEVLDQTRGTDGLGVISSSITIDKAGVVRGLIANTSSERSFRNAQVAVRNRFMSERISFDIQPGETAPFEVETNLNEPPRAEDIRIRAAQSRRVDRGLRSIQASLMQVHPTDSPSDKYLDASPTSSRLEREVFEFDVRPVQPHTGQKVRRIKDPFAVVAVFNSDGGVIEVERTPVLDGSGEDGGDVLRLLNSGGGRVGVSVDTEVNTFAMWMSGKKGAK